MALVVSRQDDRLESQLPARAPPDGPRGDGRRLTLRLFDFCSSVFALWLHDGLGDVDRTSFPLQGVLGAAVWPSRATLSGFDLHDVVPVCDPWLMSHDARGAPPRKAEGRLARPVFLDLTIFRGFRVAELQFFDPIRPVTEDDMNDVAPEQRGASVK